MSISFFFLTILTIETVFTHNFHLLHLSTSIDTVFEHDRNVLCVNFPTSNDDDSNSSESVLSNTNTNNTVQSTITNIIQDQIYILYNNDEHPEIIIVSNITSHNDTTIPMTLSINEKQYES